MARWGVVGAEEQLEGAVVFEEEKMPDLSLRGRAQLARKLGLAIQSEGMAQGSSGAPGPGKARVSDGVGSRG